ncbi:hypothetical protein [Fervidobacterium sp.]|uniref:hypothetical protein n=1 Tax=Fervidobacterium sp. TaxID=1871331 RepID=UPI0025BC9025|nr:hypothetical protein [Fervidobacterium sp.]
MSSEGGVVGYMSSGNLSSMSSSKKDYTRTMRLSVIEGALYTLAFNATQGFVYSTLALYFNFDPVLVSVLAVLPASSQLVQFFSPVIYKIIPSRKKAIFWIAFIARASFVIIPLSLSNGY